MAEDPVAVVERIVSRAVADERKRVLDIVALCSLVYRPDLVRGYVEAGMAAGDVAHDLHRIVLDQDQPEARIH